MTLEDILNKYNAPNGKTVLKMDCEGAEYEIILFATVDTLLRFNHLLIEYHYGYKNLKEKLEECGFKDGTLDKEATSYNDIFDAFRLALKFYHFRDSSEYH